MTHFRRNGLSVALFLASVFAPIISYSQPVDPSLYQSMRWRCIGPFRAGRTVGAVGIPQLPNTFYIGVNNGGVWKTDDAGRTWKPIFDDQPTGSIGDVAIAPSNPNVVYVGSGEGLQRPDLSTGDGMYKSIDGGKTWEHLGLRDGQQIASIAVDPKDENRLFVAVLGHPYGPNPERGIYRSVDGGRSFQRVLYKDEDTGAFQVEIDPKNSKIVYADMWAGRQGPWENGAWQGKGSGLFKSTDGGTTWKKLVNGLPTFEQGLGRIGFAISRSNTKRMYATVDAQAKVAGLYVSNDAGENWSFVNGDNRIWGRGSDFAEIKVHPTIPDIIYVANTASYRSSDGGKTFTGFKGAPGGDDYHRFWINPDHPEIILVASDQGATITVNGGETWSSWYNQPTAQMYHVATDNQWPYWVYSGQQESGSAGVASRGDAGAIIARDWRTVGLEEYGYAAPDPLDPNIIYGGKLSRFDKRTGQVQNIMPEAVRTGKYRFLRTAPVVFSPVDPHILYFAGNVVFKTTTGGQSWDVISPDLSRDRWDVPGNVGVYKTKDMETMPRRGVVYTVAPSYRDVNTIWAGTDDGLIHVTRDGGKNWQNVTPPELRSWAKVSLIDAGRFDANTAYAAVNTFRLDDLRPHIFRTHDGGKTWQETVKGIPDGRIINVVREDPMRKGLLYAGAEGEVYFSIDDGANWQPLRLNMPATSIRDLVIHGDDVVVGTHGRSFWILDDITPLRQIAADSKAQEAILFAPQQATRVKRSVHTDTPFPPEEPAGQNPPDGAIINYYLREKASSPITLEILDSSGKLVRKFSSDDKPLQVDPNKLRFPTYWVRPFQPLKNEPGMQRFVWDMMYPNPPADYDLPISAVVHDTPYVPQGPAVLPGTYTARLTVNGKSITKSFTVRIDPRLKTPFSALQQQFAMSMQAYEGVKRTADISEAVKEISDRLAAAKTKPGQSAEVLKNIETAEQKIKVLNNGGVAGVLAEMGLARLNASFAGLLDLLQDADVAPSSQAVSAGRDLQTALAKAEKNFKELTDFVASARL
ncbi:MAG: glycoside hydrolase [Acidobacteria bacterium]|nr:glycoside hydrolase [Acidobacteriota bacterium]